MIWKSLLWIELLLLISCSRDNVAGKPVADETTNGVSVLIVDAGGKPVSRAHIAIMPAWSTAEADVLMLETDPDGRLHLDSLPAKAMWAEIQKEGQGVRIFLEAGVDTTVIIQALGAITGSAAVGSVVSLYGSTHSLRVGSSGVYNLDAIPPGTWVVRVEEPSGILVEEARVNVLPGTMVDVQTGGSSLADWTTWKHHHRVAIATYENAPDTLLSDLSLAIVLEDALELDTHSLRVLDPSGERLPCEIEEIDSTAGTAVLWCQVNIALRKGALFHVVWGKQGVLRDGLAYPDSLVYGNWRFGSDQPYANTLGMGPDIYKDSLTQVSEGRFGSGRSNHAFSALFIKSPPTELDSFTLSCWMRYSGEPQIQYAKVVHMGWPGFPYGTFMIDIDTVTKLPAFQVAQADSQYIRVVAQKKAGRDDAILSGERWVHVAATWSRQSGEAKFFMDGELQGVGKTMGPLLSHLTPTHYDILVGNQLSMRAGFKGVIDDFRFETRIRSPLYIQYQYWLLTQSFQ